MGEIRFVDTGLALRQGAPTRTINRPKVMLNKTALFVPFLAAALCSLANAAANSLESARTAYDEGRFLEAAEMAEALGTAQGFTLANLSLVAHGYYIADDDEKQGLYERAMALGEKAVDLDPDDAESALRWGHAMGRYTQTIGSLKAFRQGFAGRIREAFEKAVSIDPDMAEAHISLGAWHVEGIKEGGFMARATLGASNRTGANHYERGLELDPESKVGVYEYARGLLMLSERKNRVRAREMFVNALEIPPANAADRLLDEKIARKIAKLDG